MPKDTVWEVIKQRTEPGSPKLKAQNNVQVTNMTQNILYSKKQDSWTWKLCLQENPVVKKNLITTEITINFHIFS